MSIEKMGSGSSEKEPIIEYTFIYPDGSEAEGSFSEDQEEIYVEVVGDAHKILPYRKIVKGIVDHDNKVIKWSDGSETKGESSGDIVFAQDVDGDRRMLHEKNILIGKVDKEKKEVRFE